MPNKWLPNSSSGIAFSTVGSINGAKYRVRHKNLTWLSQSGFVSGSAAGSVTTREGSLWGASGNVRFVSGGTDNNLGTYQSVFGLANAAARIDDNEIDFELQINGNWTMKVDGVETSSGTITRGTGNAADNRYIIGARALQSWLSDETITSELSSGDKVGDTEVWLDDVLVLYAVMPSTADATTVPDTSGNNNTGTLIGGDDTDFEAGSDIVEPPTVTAPTLAKMVKAPCSASSYIIGPANAPRTTLGKIESPVAFTHARVHMYSAGACSNIEVAVAPTSVSANNSLNNSYKPFNAQGTIDDTLWESGVMPEITAASVLNENTFGTPYLRSSVSDWFEVEAIADENGKYHILLRLRVGTGASTIVGGSPVAMQSYLNASGETFYKMFIANASTTITDAHDYSQIDDENLIGGFPHLFAIEFGITNTNAVSMVAIGDSITADAEITPTQGFNIWPLVAFGESADSDSKPFFFTNAAMSARNEGFMATGSSQNDNGWGYGNHYNDIISSGAKFDYVLCPAFTPNGGLPNTTNSEGTTRENEQKAWLDWVVVKTLAESSKLILWEGIPNQSYSAATDAIRIAINNYGQALATNNAHVYYIDAGSQVDTKTTPNRVQAQYSADDFHLNNSGNDVLAAYAETEFNRIINGVTVDASTLTMTLTDIPDGNYQTRIINADTNSLVFSGELAWSGGTSTRLTNLPMGTNLEYYAIGVDDGGIDRGLTA